MPNPRQAGSFRAAGLGIICLPPLHAEDLVHQGQLAMLLEPYAPEPAAMYINYVTQHYVTGKVQALIDYIDEHYHCPKQAIESVTPENSQS